MFVIFSVVRAVVAGRSRHENSLAHVAVYAVAILVDEGRQQFRLVVVRLEGALVFAARLVGIYIVISRGAIYAFAQNVG